MLVARNWGKEKGGVVVSLVQSFTEEDEKVLEMGGGDGHTII